jgi:hypothetical protein
MERVAIHEPLLINTIGHSVGTILFAVFLYLVIRDQPGVPMRTKRLPVIAAALALAWNAASLTVVWMLDASLSGAEFVSAAGLAALSLLPAVLLQLALGGRGRWISVAAYAMGAAIIGIHLSEFFFSAPELHAFALQAATIGFALLTLAATAALLRTRDADRQQRTRRLLGTMALFLFALSFVHFRFEFEPQVWHLEVLVHHAGIPLAMFVLLQDFRFVFLDALVRVLANLTVAGAALGIGFWVLHLFGIHLAGNATPFRSGVLLVGAALGLVGFAAVRRRFQQLLTRVLFRRGDLDLALAELRTHEGIAGDGDYLEWAMERIGAFMEARPVQAGSALAERMQELELHQPALAGELPDSRLLLADRDVEVVAPLRLTGETKFLLFGRRPGGRPYLSEDLEALGRLIEQVSEHVTHYRDLELRRLVSQAELRALQSQIHPHFLFNALNSLYGIIPKQAAGARETVLNLADILRYFLQGEKTWIPLEEELNIVRAYLEVEKLRLGDRLQVEMNVDPSAVRRRIPMLSLQPLVENAVKHGVARQAAGGTVRVFVGFGEDRMTVKVSDTGPGFPTARSQGGGLGVGLENVERRLRLCYGADCALRIVSGPGETHVGFTAPAGQPAEVSG